MSLVLMFLQLQMLHTGTHSRRHIFFFNLFLSFVKFEVG